MNNKYFQIAVLIILAVLVLFVLKTKPKPTPVENNNLSPETMATPDVIVDTPQPNDLITSPVMVKGRARGSWYFEANLPVALKDGNNNVIAQKGFYAVTDWMTTNYVDFNDTLTFTMPATQYGTLVISKDNPSGDPINDASFTVPVKFW